MLTISFLKENFHIINKKYFNDNLKEPQFEITHVKSYLGQYHWKRKFWNDDILDESIIRISDMFDRSDEDVINTLAHEMIHLYIRQNNIRDTRPHHGKVFYSIADRLNREGGFHISRCDSIEGVGFRNKKDVTFYVGCYITRSNKYFTFVIHRNYINEYLRDFINYPRIFKDGFIFKTNDDKTFAHYVVCRKRIRGFYTTQEKFEEYKAQAECVWDKSKHHAA